MTTAEKISDLFGDDGQAFEAADGTRIMDECERLYESREHNSAGSTKYIFEDGSVITIAGDGWDLGYPDCWCWQGAGHHDCPADPEYDATNY